MGKTRYHITERAKESPLLVAIPSTKEYVGIGGVYEVSERVNCAGCSEKQREAKIAAAKSKPKKVYREALPHEYEEIVLAYHKTKGIPEYLILLPPDETPAHLAGALDGEEQKAKKNKKGEIETETGE